MKYFEHWRTKGLDFIVPPGGDNPEGFDVGDVLTALIPGDVLEIGCGTGRIAKHFDPYKYHGVDINPAALAVAGAALPLHAFSYWDGVSMLPKARTALLYTVALHVPDDLIEALIRRAAEAAPRVIVAEIMNPAFRKNRNPADEYHVSNQRSLNEYMALAQGVGLRVERIKALPYAFYQGEFITFAVFERAES